MQDRLVFQSSVSCPAGSPALKKLSQLSTTARKRNRATLWVAWLKGRQARILQLLRVLLLAKRVFSVH